MRDRRSQYDEAGREWVPFVVGRALDGRPVIDYAVVHKPVPDVIGGDPSRMATWLVGGLLVFSAVLNLLLGAGLLFAAGTAAWHVAGIALDVVRELRS